MSELPGPTVNCQTMDQRKKEANIGYVAGNAIYKCHWDSLSINMHHKLIMIVSHHGHSWKSAASWLMQYFMSVMKWREGGVQLFNNSASLQATYSLVVVCTCIISTFQREARLQRSPCRLISSPFFSLVVVQHLGRVLVYLNQHWQYCGH